MPPVNCLICLADNVSALFPCRQCSQVICVDCMHRLAGVNPFPICPFCRCSYLELYECAYCKEILEADVRIYVAEPCGHLFCFICGYSAIHTNMCDECLQPCVAYPTQLYYSIDKIIMASNV